MGCGPSRPSGPSRSFYFSTDCSGSYCNMYLIDNNDTKFRNREFAEQLLMDYKTFVKFFNALGMTDTTTTLMRDYYRKYMTFLNENTEYISDEKCALLYAAMGSSFETTVILMGKTMSAAFRVDSNPWTVWQDRYVKVLRDITMNSDTPQDIVKKSETWLAANPAPANDGFTDIITDLKNLKNFKHFKNFSNHNSFLSFKNEVMSDNNKIISGFTNYSVLKNGLVNEYHSF